MLSSAVAPGGRQTIIGRKLILILIPWKHCSCFHCRSHLAPLCVFLRCPPIKKKHQNKPNKPNPKPLGLTHPVFAILQLLHCHCKSVGHSSLFPHSNSAATTEPNEDFLLIWFLWSSTCQAFDHRSLACAYILQDPELTLLQLPAETAAAQLAWAAQAVCTHFTEATATINPRCISSSL